MTTTAMITPAEWHSFLALMAGVFLLGVVLPAIIAGLMSLRDGDDEEKP